MRRMKAAVYYDKEDIRLEEMPVPKIGDGEVLVQMKVCGVCGSDLMDWYIKPRAPIVLGHEPVGTISEKGVKTNGFELGERVFVHHHVACLKCHYCLHGDFTLCEEFHKTRIVPGGFAEKIRVPNRNLAIDTLKIPDQVTDEEATFIEPLGCCLRALKKCKIQIGDVVAVLGCGGTGALHIAVSKLLGASMVVASDFFEERLRRAKEFGADVIINAKEESLRDVVQSVSGGRGADVVVVTAPSISAYSNALETVRRGGTVCAFAPTEPGKTLQVSPKGLFFSEVKITPSYSTSHVETREALELIRNRRVDVAGMVTSRFALSEVEAALKAAREDMSNLKVIVVNEQ